ncbi:MAG TPA: DUF3343 domain-containing protein [Firmicutes bacterium]|nr:DUF3343 domain-containing protein [Bacillota bacterium]
MVGSGEFWYIVFPTTYWALRTEKVFVAEGFQAKLRPVPRALSSSCGLALEVRNAEKTDIVTVLEVHGLQYEGIFLLA